MTERFDTFSPPPRSWGEPDLTHVLAVAEDEAELDPRVAATLLDETTRQAERQFEVQPILLMLAAAVTVLVAYGAVWVSVRHQHPYTGPSGTALGVLYGTLAAWIVLVVVVQTRALSGRRSRQRRLDGLAFAAIWICVYVFEGALRHAGASKAIAFGVWPASAPLLVVGSAATAYEAGRGRQGPAILAGAVVLLGASAAFAGPDGIWGVIAVGWCALLLVGAGGRLWQRYAQANG
jgi:hypothetical protein